MLTAPGGRVGDQPFLLANLSWLINYFHFLSEMEPGKSLNCYLKKILPIVFHQVKFGLARMCELHSGASQSWDSDLTIHCHTDLAGL